MSQKDLEVSEKVFFNLYAHEPVYSFVRDLHAIKMILQALTTTRADEKKRIGDFMLKIDNVYLTPKNREGLRQAIKDYEDTK